MSDLLIRFIKPVIPAPEAWLKHLRESYEVGYFANTGPAAKTFERRLREKYARGRAAVAAPNATNALVAGLQALGIEGKVLTPSYTFPATAHAILMAGCEPEFCDIAPDDWGMDPAAAEARLARGGIAAMLHMRPYGFGHSAAALEDLARRHRIPLIIDAASALGGESSRTGHVGQQGDMEVFSLHATKVFAIGEGGVTFMRPELEQRFRRVSNFGLDYPDIVDAGLNSKLSDFQAAVGLSVLDSIDGYIAQRKLIAQHYAARLAGLTAVRLAPPAEWAPWQYYPVLLQRDRDVGRIITAALDRGLELKRGYYKPLHQSSFFGRYGHGPLPVSEDVAAHVVCLPVYSDMPVTLAERVLEILLPLLG